MWEELQLTTYLSDFEYLHPFRRYSPLKFEVVRNQTKFCIFLAPRKVSTCVIKFGLLLIILQNFAVIGWRSLEIPCQKY